MKEMVGGCCVCSDERGWPENPLVYCDGQHCTVAVHQACYGIVTVPTGPWYCRKCESQERSARVRCELCPSRDGALKRTDNQSWAHVVCALYIPEVRFGNVTTMEPIILQLIPQERFSKVCYICQDIGKGSRGNIGACMQCNKSGCKQQFHVTCAQALGLLCEEAGNYLDNVKYCGYCQHHYSKLKKGGNVKTIPPYKPSHHEVGSDPSSSPEKESEPSSSASLNLTSSFNSSKVIVPSSSGSTNLAGQSQAIQSTTSSTSSSTGSRQRKSGDVNSGSSSTTTSSTVVPALSKQQQQQPNAQSNNGNNSGQSSGNNINTSTTNDNSSHGSIESSNGKEKPNKSTNKVTSSSKSSSKESRDKQHNKGIKGHGKDNSNSSTNDFDTNSSGNGTPNASLPSKDMSNQKFTTSNFTESIVVNSDSVFGGNTGGSTDPKSLTQPSSNVPIVKKRKLDSTKSTPSTSPHDETNRDSIKDVSVTLVPLPYDKTDSSDRKQKLSDSNLSVLQSSHISGGPSNITNTETTTSAVSLVVSVPLSTASLSGVNLTNSNTSLHQPPTVKSFGVLDGQQSSIISRSSALGNNLSSIDARDKDSTTIIRNSSPLPNPNKISLITESKTKNMYTDYPSSSAHIITTMESGGIKITYDKQTNSKQMHSHDENNLVRMTNTPDDNSNSFSDLKISFEQQPNTYDAPPTITPRQDIKDSPPSSPNSDTCSIKRSSNDAKDMKIFQKAPHMLGNHLNPASSVAQKMSDQLCMEIEAHSAYTSSSMDSSNPFIGPTYPGKQLSQARASAAAQPQGPSLSSMLGGTGIPTANGNTPQSLEQLLERQWEQGSQFLMEQAQHFDIASLLSCLHQLRSENVRLEEHVNNLVARRDHLLAVNARLALPLNQIPQVSNPGQAPFNNIHMNGTGEPSSRRSHHLK